MGLTPAFSTPAICSRIFHSCIFQPCNYARAAFSTPAFSVAPRNLVPENWYRKSGVKIERVLFVKGCLWRHNSTQLDVELSLVEFS